MTNGSYLVIVTSVDADGIAKSHARHIKGEKKVL